MSNGNYGIIDSVIITELQKEEVTYNFEVEDFHTYFVGEYSVCVHNTGKCGDYEMANRGSTGRDTPENLNEQIAMNSAKNHPEIGENIEKYIGKVGDKRWPIEQGWSKYQVVCYSENGNNVTIHYLRSDKLMLVDDFKIK